MDIQFATRPVNNDFNLGNMLTVARSGVDKSRLTRLTYLLTTLRRYGAVPSIDVRQEMSAFSHTLAMPLLPPEDPRYGSSARGLTVDGAWELIHYNNYDVKPAEGMVTVHDASKYKKIVFDFEAQR